MNTVLTQEIIRYVTNLSFIFIYRLLICCFRYNKLLNVIHTSLQELLKAMKGLVVLFTSIRRNVKKFI